MNEMPKRIWAHADGFWGVSELIKKTKSWVEYVRVDAVDEMIEDAVKRQMEVHGITQRNPQRHSKDTLDERVQQELKELDAFACSIKGKLLPRGAGILPPIVRPVVPLIDGGEDDLIDEDDWSGTNPEGDF